MNPLLNAISPQGGNLGNITQIKNMMNMLKMAQNPQVAVEKLANENPMIKSIMSMNNGDLKSTFYKMCREKGVNPDDIIKQLQN